MHSGRLEVLILDEVIVAVAFKLLPVQELLNFIKEKPLLVELVLTGRGATQEIIDAADLVTRMVEVKHPYQQGVPARKGIEF